MQTEMSFLEKLSYRLGKDPFKGKKGRVSPFVVAVRENDMNRLNFFGKNCKLDRAKLIDSLKEVNHPKSLRKLMKLGADMNETMKASVIKRIATNALYKATSSLRDKEMMEFLRNCKISLNIKDAAGNSFFDCARNKEDWFNAATPEEIGHEFRQAVAIGNFKKTTEMMRSEKLDINAQNKDGRSAMTYALEKGGAEFVTLLYEHGAQLGTVDKDGKNAFDYANPKMRETLMSLCIQKGDMGNLLLAEKSGCTFDNPEYMKMAKNKEMMRFLSSRGAPVHQAIDDAMEADRRESFGYGNAAERLAFLNALAKKGADKK